MKPSNKCKTLKRQTTFLWSSLDKLGKWRSRGGQAGETRMERRLDRLSLGAFEQVSNVRNRMYRLLHIEHFTYLKLDCIK